MPFEYTSPVNESIPVTETKPVKEIEVVEIQINLKGSRVVYKYVKKYDDGQGGTVTGEKIYSQVFADVPSESITDYTDLIIRNGAVYASMKTSTYTELSTALGLSGNIT